MEGKIRIKRITRFLFGGILILFFFISTHSLNSQEIEICSHDWNQLTGIVIPDGGKANKIATHPEDPLTVYLGTILGGSLYKTIDGGITWDTLFSETGILDIQFHPENAETLFVLTYNSILKTIDGGTNWTAINLDIDPWSSLLSFAVNPKYPDTLFVGTGGIFGGTLFRSFNGGISWAGITQPPIAGENIVSITIDKYDGHTLYVGGHSFGRVYKSTDLGTTWETILTSSSSNFFFDHVLLSYNRGADSLYTIYSYNTGIMKSIDEGETWETIVDTNLKVQSLEIGQGDSPEMFMGVRGSGVFYALENDTTWIHCGNGIDSLSIVDLEYNPIGGKIYAAINPRMPGDENGFYYLIIDSSQISTKNENNIHPDQATIIKNFPNPFNPATQIKFGLPEKSHIQLVVYDLLGREIVTLKSGKADAGYYSIKWDGRDENGNPLSSGVYIIQMSAQSLEGNEGFTKSQKVVLLK